MGLLSVHCHGSWVGSLSACGPGSRVGGVTAHRQPQVSGGVPSACCPGLRWRYRARALSALQDLEPQQLLLFVQSFGIPVSSMSKLLRFLDQAVAHDPQTLEQNIMDKSKMPGTCGVGHTWTEPHPGQAFGAWVGAGG